MHSIKVLEFVFLLMKTVKKLGLTIFVKSVKLTIFTMQFATFVNSKIQTVKYFQIKNNACNAESIST